jgi:hypothetical protein
MKDVMKRQSWVGRAVWCVPALLGASVLIQCGGTKREFAENTAGAGAGGMPATAGSGALSSGGRSGAAAGGRSGAAGSDESQAGQSGEAGMSGLAGEGGSSSDERSPVGSQCSKSGDCQLGNCIDGVCCESACSGCNACSSALTGKADGSCAPVVDGQDPHDECQDVTATNQCGTDGACNGTGACRYVGNSHVCKAAACSGSNFTPAATCDGAGECKTPPAESCGAAQCAVTGCLTSCSTQAQCSPSSYCKIPSGSSSGTCTAKNPNGVAVTQTFECSSGIVADGVCCNEACNGCKACSGAPLTGGAAGQCLNVVAGKVAHNACTASGKTCGLDGSCDGTGACRSTPLQGQACTGADLCITGSTCNAGSCSGGTAKACAAPAVCKQAGVCAPATGLCSYANAANNSSCNDNNACTSSDKCTNGSCGGALCPTTSHPSCSPSTNTCVCRIKDPSNLLTNPGFETSMSGWETGNYTFALRDDVEACPQSKSAFAAQGGTSGYPSQCVPVLASAKYYFGVKYTGGGSPGDGFTLDFYSKPGCAGDLLGTLNLSTIDPSTAPAWVSASTSSTSPPGSQSARFSSYIYLRGLDQAYVGTVDKF